MDNDILNKMAILSALQDAKTSDNDENLFIMSVCEAATLIDLHGGINRGAYCSKVVDYVTNPDNHVYGSPEEYHNLISRFLKFGDYFSAMSLCDYALTMFPYSVNILANAIQAAGQSGRFEKGKKYLDSANQIDKKCWSWRLFLFSIIYYKRLFDQCAPDALDSNYKKAIDLAHEYQKYLPLDERAYNQEAEILLYKNNISEAKNVLRKAIFEGVLIEGEPVKLIAAQCCVTLLNDVLDDSDEYDLIIKTAQKGIQFTTQEQPSSKIGYFVYRSALAKDALIVCDNYRNKADILEALREYQCAYDLNQDMGYAKTIEERYTILCQSCKDPIEDMPLKKRPLSVSPGE